jgi:hypothetical protein
MKNLKDLYLELGRCLKVAESHVLRLGLVLASL